MNACCNEINVPIASECVLTDIEVRLSKAEDKQLSDADLLSLHSVFGVTLQKALDIFEKYPTFTIYVTSKKRILIEVKGDKDTYYRVFPKLNYCPCLAFKLLVLEKKTEVTCKHILAARIAEILGKTVEHEVTHEQYLMLLKSMYQIKEEDGNL